MAIVTWNSGGHIAACLRSLLEQARGVPIEVIVVDNGSHDDTVRIVRDEFPGVRLLEAGANLGFPLANNLALEHARGRHFMLLNPDARLLCDAPAVLSRFLDANPQAGAAGPRILESDGSPALFSAREFPSLKSALLRYFGLRKLFPKSALFGAETLADKLGDADAARVPCLTGAALMLRTDTLRALGGLDTDLPMYLEDIDLCARVTRTGGGCWFVPQARVAHAGAGSSVLSPRRAQLLAAENGQAPWMFLRRHVSPVAAVAFSGLTFLGAIFRVGLCSLLLPLMRGELREKLAAVCFEYRALLSWSLCDKDAFLIEFRALFDYCPRPGALTRFTQEAGQ